MRTSRLEAFSDGVLAIIITIMVLELQVPEGHTFSDLVVESGTGFLSYILSFTYIGIYWNNHHHLFQLVRKPTGRILWANLHLLFWLSLYPFTTAWMDESDLARDPTTAYAVNLLLAAVAYFVLQSQIMKAEGGDGPLHRALGNDLKGKISPALYVCGIIAALTISATRPWAAWLAIGFFVAVAVIWLVPDSRIERAVAERESAAQD
jgi:uncharacterized membrane protein